MNTRDGVWEMTVSAPKMFTDDGNGSLAPAGSTWATLHVRVRNLTRQSQDISPWLEFNLYDTAGNHESYVAGISPDEFGLTSVSVPAGDTRQGDLGFELPLSVHNHELTYSTTHSGGTTGITAWDVTFP